MGLRASMYLERRSGATPVHVLHLLQLRISLDELFRSPAREADREAAIFFIALNADDSSNAIVWMTNLLPEKRIGISTASGGRTR